MGCGANAALKESCEDKEQLNAFKKLKNTINAYKEGINEYKKFLEEYQNILEQKLLCEKDLNKYFNLQKNINMQNEPKEIQNFKKIFNRVDRLEQKLDIHPGCIKIDVNKKKENKADNKENKQKQKEQDNNNKGKEKSKKKK